MVRELGPVLCGEAALEAFMTQQHSFAGAMLVADEYIGRNQYADAVRKAAEGDSMHFSHAVIVYECLAGGIQKFMV